MDFRFRSAFPKYRQRMGSMFPGFHPPSPAFPLQPNPQTPHLPVPRHQFVKVPRPNLGQHILLQNPEESLFREPLDFQIPTPFVPGNPFSAPLMMDGGNSTVDPPPEGAQQTMKE